MSVVHYCCPKSQVYQSIFEDLKYVTESPLLDVQPASACGKVSKAAAWALWGKALLQQACDEDFIGSKSELLGQAIGKLTAAWDLRKFGELSSVSYSSVWDLSTQKSCAENIFQVNYIQGNADLDIFLVHREPKPVVMPYNGSSEEAIFWSR